MTAHLEREKNLEKLAAEARAMLGKKGEEILRPNLSFRDGVFLDYGEDRRAYLLELENGDLFTVIANNGKTTAIYINQTSMIKQDIQTGLHLRVPIKASSERITSSHLKAFIDRELGQISLVDREAIRD